MWKEQCRKQTHNEKLTLSLLDFIGRIRLKRILKILSREVWEWGSVGRVLARRYEVLGSSPGFP